MLDSLKMKMQKISDLKKVNLAKSLSGKLEIHFTNENQQNVNAKSPEVVKDVEIPISLMEQDEAKVRSC